MQTETTEIEKMHEKMYEKIYCKEQLGEEAERMISLRKKTRENAAAHLQTHLAAFLNEASDEDILLLRDILQFASAWAYDLIYGIHCALEG